MNFEDIVDINKGKLIITDQRVLYKQKQVLLAAMPKKMRYKEAQKKCNNSFNPGPPEIEELARDVQNKKPLNHLQLLDLIGKK